MIYLHLYPKAHRHDCDYHVDQYSWECTCGMTHWWKMIMAIVAAKKEKIDGEA